MGAQLPKPVTSKVLERYGNEHFACGVAQMNGYRERMEDAHSATFGKNYGFFAVFDGHMDPHCSAWMGKEFPLAIASKGPPISDEALIQLTVDLDQRYLSINAESGSTGTFFIAAPDDASTPEDPQYEIQVGNVGDSRVLMGRNGVAISLTTDHKPNLDEERARIEQCGGSVSNARVDGNLAVSRAFGDGQYKTGNGGPTMQKVIAVPEVRHTKAKPGDFMVLSCDGVFEGNFTNDEVVEFITNKLKTESDLAVVAAAVCDQALERGSKDNITCMLVQFKDGRSCSSPEEEFVPGPYAAPHHSGFRSAYLSMAEKMKISLGQALEMRYDYLKKQLALRSTQLGLTSTDPGAQPDLTKMSETDMKGILQSYKELTDGMSRDELVAKLKQLGEEGKSITPPDIRDLTDELATYGEGPPETEKGGDRVAWFESHAQAMAQSENDTGSEEGDSTNKMIVDASTFAKLQAVQQQTGGTIPLHVLMQLLQASAVSMSKNDDDS